ncbi:MAG: ribosomal protection-like ABC-F family protein [Anaerolineales bacterium]
MLTAHAINKSYHLNQILSEVTFSINQGDCTGLVGPNGCGKTTLIKILAGIEPPDSGHVALNPKRLSVGYLAQSLPADPDQTLGSVLEDTFGNPSKLASRLQVLAAALATQQDNLELQSQYDAVLSRMESLDPAQLAHQECILAALGLDHIPRDVHIAEFSGGQKTRLGLALVLLRQPRLLLLDEPTNHLDIQMLEWLEDWLVDYTQRRHNAALVISHDRTFLDRTVSRILDLDPTTHSVTEYAGCYSDYIRQVTANHELQVSAYKDQVYEIRRMRQDITRTKGQSLQVELSTTSRQPGVRRIAKKVARKAKSRQKKLDRYLDSDKRVEKPKPGWQMKLEFDEQMHTGQDVLALRDLAIGYPGHPVLAGDIRGHIRSGERVVLTGPNGCGKTTLLRTIAGLVELKSGSLQMESSISLGYMAQEQELLDQELSALQTVQMLAPQNETEARSFLHYFLFSGDDALRPAYQLSFGERSRLALASLVVRGCNFLLLDEPINHLDIPSRERFEQALAHFDGTILAVVHDRYFIERFATRLWEMGEGRLVDRG